MTGEHLHEPMKVVGPLFVGQAIISAGTGVSARILTRLDPQTRDADTLIIWLLAGFALVAVNILVYQITFLARMPARSICLELATSALLLALTAFAADPSFRLSSGHLTVLSSMTFMLAALYAYNWGWVVDLRNRTLRKAKRVFNSLLCLPPLFIFIAVRFTDRQTALETTFRIALIAVTVVLLAYVVVGWRLIFQIRDAAKRYEPDAGLPVADMPPSS